MKAWRAHPFCDQEVLESASLCSFAYFNGNHGAVRIVNVVTCGDHDDLHHIEFVVNDSYFTHFDGATSANLDLYYKMNSVSGIGHDFSSRNYEHYGLHTVDLMKGDSDGLGSLVTHCDIGSGSDPPSTSYSSQSRPSWPTPKPAGGPTAIPSVIVHEEPTPFPIRFNSVPTKHPLINGGDPAAIPSSSPSAFGWNGNGSIPTVIPIVSPS